MNKLISYINSIVKLDSEILKKLYEQNRINAKTYVFAPGMDNWTFLGDIPIYNRYFSEVPPVIEDDERKKIIASLAIEEEIWSFKECIKLITKFMEISSNQSKKVLME